MLLKALKFMTLIHRQIECSQWDHQYFPGKVFFQKNSTVLRTSQYVWQRQKSWETKKMERKNCLFKVEMKIWATAKRQKRASSGDEAPLSNWKLTSVDQWSHIQLLIRSDIQVSHKREHHTQNEPFCDHVNLFCRISSSKSTEEEIGF